MNLDEAFEQWYFGEGYPSYALRWNTGNGDLFLRLSQNVSAPTITPLFTTPVEIRFSRTGLPDTTIRIPVGSNNELLLIPGMGQASGTPVVDPSNFLVNRTTLVQKDPTLVITRNNPRKSSSEVTILPAEKDGEFRFRASENEIWNYQLLDTRGRILHTNTIENGKLLNLSGQPAGQYLIRLESQGKSRVHHRILHR